MENGLGAPVLLTDYCLWHRVGENTRQRHRIDTLQPQYNQEGVRDLACIPTMGDEIGSLIFLAVNIS
jgi:hypothetical protein